jgi:hypothetical protein
MSVILCRWEATDILVLSPTSDRAAFQVVETLKGEATPGDTIVLGELAPPDDVAAFREKAEREGTIPEPPPATQPGDRMIAFLLRPGAKLEYFSPPEASNTDGWRSASGFGDMRFSAVWLRHGEAFAIFQAGNPAPTTFDDLGITVQEVRRQIDEGIQMRASLDRALASPADSVGRAVQLGELVRSGDFIASGSALRYLATGGTAAAEVLRGLLSDPKLLELHSGIVYTLAKTGVGNSVLLQILSEETQYWSAACGLLAPGWWSGPDWAEVVKRRAHYEKALAALRGIHESLLASDLSELRNFHEVWIKCPPMAENESTQSQISIELDRLLRPRRED